MSLVKNLRASVIVTIAALFASSPVNGQICKLRWTGVLCSSCGTSGPPAYVGYWWGCVACLGLCPQFLGSDAEDPSGKAEIAGLDASAISRQLSISASQLRDIGARNPWAASILFSLVDIGGLAKIDGATSYLTLLPTPESVDALIAGNNELAKSVATDAEVRGRVTHRLERGPGTSARLYMSSFVADADERMLYKPYPDIVIELYEVPATIQRAETPGTGVQKSEGESSDTRPLVVQSWKVAE